MVGFLINTLLFSGYPWSCALGFALGGIAGTSSNWAGALVCQRARFTLWLRLVELSPLIVSAGSGWIMPSGFVGVMTGAATSMLVSAPLFRSQKK